MRQTIFPRREIFEQNHIAVPSGRFPTSAVSDEIFVTRRVSAVSCTLIVSGTTCRFCGSSFSTEERESPPSFNHSVPSSCHSHHPANPNLAHRHGYRKRDRQVSSRIHPTPKQATESGETEKRERAPTEQPHARLCI